MMSKCQMCGFPATTGGCLNATCPTNRIALNGFGHGRDIATRRARVAVLQRDIARRDEDAAVLPEDFSITETVATLRARVEELRQAVLRFGWHDGDCDYILDALPCTCGLDAVEESLK